MQDVALLAVLVMQQRDARRAVGIVLHRRYCGRNAGLIALEIDHAVRLLVASADESRSHAPVAVAAASPLLGLEQRFLGPLLGNILARNDGLEPPRRCGRSVSLDRHRLN